jgi:uncharacterized membrane protein
VNWFLTVCLWLHVAAGSWWVLASVTMAVAGAVVSAESGEGREFVVRVVPKFNRANAAAAALLLATGVVNVFGAGARRHFAFPAAFTDVLAVKVGLYVLMVAALMALFGVERNPRRANPGAAVPIRTGRLVALSALIALAGALAMILGVWLAGD